MRASQVKRMRRIAKQATKREDKPGYARFYKAMKSAFIANSKAGLNKLTGRGATLAFENTIQ
jgi:hypothetical protein